MRLAGGVLADAQRQNAADRYDIGSGCQRFCHDVAEPFGRNVFLEGKRTAVFRDEVRDGQVFGDVISQKSSRESHMRVHQVNLSEMFLNLADRVDEQRHQRQVVAFTDVAGPGQVRNFEFGQMSGVADDFLLMGFEGSQPPN